MTYRDPLSFVRPLVGFLIQFLRCEIQANGPVAAALLAGALGSAAIGIATVLAEASSQVADAFKWSPAVGSLSGNVGVGLIIYFASWIALHSVLRRKNVNFTRITIVAFVLLAIGLLGTFPPFFELFVGK